MLSGRESWVLDELAYAGRENRDANHAAKYDKKMDAEAFQEVALLQARGMDERSIVIDLGAGTGQFAMAASSAVGKVIAVDVSSVMLDRLKTKLESFDVNNVECKVAGFLTYTHEGPLADVVYSRFALHHLPDFWQAVALTRMASYLCPGGTLRLWDVVYSFDPADASERIEEWIEAMSTPPDLAGEGDWLRAEVEEHIKDENSTFSWLLEPMILKAGFTVESVEYSEDQMIAKYLCVKVAG